MTDTYNDLKDSGSLVKLTPINPAFEILVAEDNKINQILIIKMLKKCGLVPDVVDNGSEAFEAVKRKAYDIVFMDLHMPIMDGFEAFLAIKSYYTHPKIMPKVIAITASVVSGTKEKCLAAGFSVKFLKPHSI